MSEPIEVIPQRRVLKTAGSIRPLYLVSVNSNCGDIRNGVAFAFGDDGGWVVDLAELKRIVAEAEASR